MTQKSSKYRLLYVVLLLCSVCLTAQAEPQLVDKIVAVAGDHPILHSEAQAKVTSGPLITVSDYPATTNASRKQRAINDLINLQLIKIALTELDAGVSDAEIEREIDAFLQQKGLNRTDLDVFLRSQGKTYTQYKQDFYHQLLLRKFHGAIIVPAIKVTDEDIKTYYLKKSGRIGDLVTFDLQQIFIAGKDTQRINEAHQRLQAGTPFVEVSELYHNQHSSATMEKVQLQDLSPTIRNALRNLNEGQFSPPLETAAGQHIFYVNKRQVSVDATFAASKDELELELKNLELNNQTRLWLEKQHNQTSIKRL